VRTLGWLALLAANALVFFVYTYPALRARGALAEREATRAEQISLQQRELGRWEGVARWLERARPVLAEIYGSEEGFVIRLRQTLLALERGLPVRRRLTEYRPEAVGEGGFPGSRVRVVLVGDFANLYAYLERAAGEWTPLATTEMSLMEDPASAEGERLLLTLSFLALWPK